MTELEILTTQEDAQDDGENLTPATPPAVANNTETKASDEHMIPKSRFDEVNSKLKELMAAQSKADKEREANERKALEEQNKFQELYEKEQAEKLAAQKEMEALKIQGLRRDVATELKVPSGLISRISGSTREEIEADAKALLESLPKASAPNLDSRANGGTKSTGVPDEQIKEQAAVLGVSYEYLKEQYGA